MLQRITMVDIGKGRCLQTVGGFSTLCRSFSNEAARDFANEKAAEQRVFVGNLRYDTTEDQLYDKFVSFGNVRSAMIATDRATNRSKGFGFVHFFEKEDAKKAVSETNQKPWKGRNLNVNLANDRGKIPATAARAGSPFERLHGDVLDAMCRLGRRCVCAKHTSTFDGRINNIGASNGLGGHQLLERSRTMEVEKLSSVLREILIMDNAAPDFRKPLIQISQCAGIGKTTLLGHFSRKFANLLKEAGEILPKAGSMVPEVGIIGTLITYNGKVMPMALSGFDMSAAVSIRLLYGALSSHPAMPGVRCPDLLKFSFVEQNARSSAAILSMDEFEARELLWSWYGKRPIFAGVDEALKCEDGNIIEDPERKLANLMLSLGKFQDTSPDEPQVFVVVSSLSPHRFLKATSNSQRSIYNIMVYALEHDDAVEALKQYLQVLLPGLSIHNSVLNQLAAITGGHPRALQHLAGFVCQCGERDKSVFSSFDSCRTTFVDAVRCLAKSSVGALARQPETALFEYVISQPPLGIDRTTHTIGGAKRDIDAYVYDGQVLVVPGKEETLTIPAWWLLATLLRIGSFAYNSAGPFTNSLLECFDAVAGGKFFSAGDLYEAFCLFFVVSAVLRGGATLQAVIPSVYDAFPNLNASNCGTIRIEKLSIDDNIEGELEKARVLERRIQQLIQESSQANSKTVILLVMPKDFPLFDGILLVEGIIVGLQIKSKLDDAKLIENVEKFRTMLSGWATVGCKPLGDSPLVSFYIGVQKKPSLLELKEGETMVTNSEVRNHFLDVFFRCGLTANE